MKKSLLLILVLALLLALTACGGAPAAPAGGSNDDGDKIDTQAIADKIIDDAVIENAFSEAAALRAIKSFGGLEQADITPEWAWHIDEALMTTYGDTPGGSYGHGCIMFIADDNDLTDEEYLAWAQKVFASTAKISDDGHNIYGWDISSDKPDDEISFEEAMGIGADAMFYMQGWGYKYNGVYLSVYVEKEQDPARDSSYELVDGEYTYLAYYYGCSLDVAIGLQKSFDDTWQEMEDYFEEHEDEIEDALKDYAK